jgi:bacteriocin-like protein
MRNDLTELTDTELDAVSGGRNNLVAMNFGQIITQVNLAEQTAAVVGSGSLTQNLTQTGNNTIGTASSTTTGPFTFGNFSF